MEGVIEEILKRSMCPDKTGLTCPEKSPCMLTTADILKKVRLLEIKSKADH